MSIIWFDKLNESIILQDSGREQRRRERDAERAAAAGYQELPAENAAAVWRQQ